MTQPLVKMLCHKGPVLAAAVDPSGAYMATSGLDGQLKVFDLRTYKMMHAYYTPAPAHSLDISQRGVLAVGHGPRVTLWKDALREKQQSPYMNHLQEGAVVRNVRFCRYDDVLGIGHSEGMTSIVVPGAGEPNYDALEVNPFATKKQRQEAEVRGLLDKIQPEMISLQIDGVGALDPQSADGRREAKLKAEQALAASSPAEIAKKKARGRSKTMRRYLNKQQNVIDAKRVAVREERDMRQKEHAEREAKRDAKRGGGSSTGEEGDAMRESARKALPLALGRFATKGRK